MIALDTNILVYAVASDDPESRHVQALELVDQLGMADGAVVPIQVIGEFLNVCRRKRPVSFDHAVRRAAQFLNAFDCPQTRPNDLIDAFAVSAQHNVQYFDALIVIVACRTGATTLLSEDMKDGREIEGLRILNPFNPANRADINELLA